MKRGLITVTALGVAGVGIAAALTVLHVRAHAPAPGASFCSIDPAFDCDAVARSSYAVFAGLPVSLWGALAYASIAVLAASGLHSRRPHAAWPTGLLLAASAAAVGTSVALAIISEAVLGTLCLLCVVAWCLNAALLAVCWPLARREGGARRALAADSSALLARPAAVGATLVALAAAVAVLWTVYPRYWVPVRSDATHWNQADADQIPLPVR